MNTTILLQEFDKRSFEEKYTVVFTMVKKLAQKNNNFAAIYHSLDTLRPSELFLKKIYTQILEIYSNNKKTDKVNNNKKYEQINKRLLKNDQQSKQEQNEADSILLSL